MFLIFCTNIFLMEEKQKRHMLNTVQDMHVNFIAKSIYRMYQTQLVMQLIFHCNHHFSLSACAFIA